MPGFLPYASRVLKGRFADPDGIHPRLNRDRSGWRTRNPFADIAEMRIQLPPGSMTLKPVTPALFFLGRGRVIRGMPETSTLPYSARIPLGEGRGKLIDVRFQDQARAVRRCGPPSQGVPPTPPHCPQRYFGQWRTGSDPMGAH